MFCLLAFIKKNYLINVTIVMFWESLMMSVALTLFHVKREKNSQGRKLVLEYQSSWLLLFQRRKYFYLFINHYN